MQHHICMSGKARFEHGKSDITVCLLNHYSNLVIFYHLARRISMRSKIYSMIFIPLQGSITDTCVIVLCKATKQTLIF